MLDTYLFFLFFQLRFFIYFSPIIMKLLFSYIRYRAEKNEYANYIADLETNKVKNEQEIKELQKELKKYKDLVKERSCDLISMEDTLTPYREKIEELTKLLENEEKNGKHLEKKLANMEAKYQELNDILKVKQQSMICIY